MNKYTKVLFKCKFLRGCYWLVQYASTGLISRTTDW